MTKIPAGKCCVSVTIGLISLIWTLMLLRGMTERLLQLNQCNFGNRRVRSIIHVWCQVSEAASHFIIINEWLVPGSLCCAASTIWYETTLTCSTKQMRNIIPPLCRVANLAAHGISLPGAGDGPSTQAAFVIRWKAISAQISFRSANELAALTSARTSWPLWSSYDAALDIHTGLLSFFGCSCCCFVL